MKRFNIRDTIYHRDIFLILNCSIEECEKFLKRKYNIENDKSVWAPSARFSKIVNEEKGICHYYIWIEKFDWRLFEYAMLSHEINHLVFEVMRDVGIEFCDKSEEAYTYYIQRLTTDILLKIDKAGKVKSKKRKKK